MPPTQVVLSRTPIGDHALHEQGDKIKVSHWDLSSAQRGLERGFFVVKSEIEWRNLWPATDADKIPLLPPDLSFSKEMLLVAAPPDPDGLETAVKDVVVNDATGINIYVTETVPGIECPRPEKDSDRKNYDLARVQRIDDKQARFHLDSDRSEPCGQPPQVGVACRANGASAPLASTLTAPPGTLVSCVASGVASVRPLFDLTWTFGSLPRWTFARLAVAPESRGATFITDAFGTYKVALEATDDLQRKGAGAAEVTVLPKDPLVVQMTWARFDPGDDPTSFPRVELHAGPAPSHEAAKGAPAVPGHPAPPAPASASSASASNGSAVLGCSAEADRPPSWCTAKIAGPTTVMTLEPAAAKEFAVVVHYSDDRVQGQPIPCISVYRNAKLQTEACDPAVRKAGVWWDAATIDAATGKTAEALAQEQAMATEATAKAQMAAPAKAGDAGAPDAGASGKPPAKR